MKKKVVVENVLEDVRNFFGKKGYDVRTVHFNDTIKDIDVDEYDAIIVNDMNNANLPEEIKNTGKVIEAMGLVPHQVYEKMNHRIMK